MPVSVVVGGQYGSEGKGKVAQYLAAKSQAAAVVRVGGSNSGHSTLAPAAERQVFRHLPTAAVLPDVMCVIPPGSYVRVPVLLEEIERSGLPRDRLIIDPRAALVTDHDIDTERGSGLGSRIGSTCSGTGEAVIKRIRRRVVDDLVVASRDLRPYLGDTTEYLRGLLKADERVVVEGTQGFGLSVLHSPHFPMVTARDTSAAGALSEAGLSPLDVDQVVTVLRALPIRVTGNSGPFGAEELDWEQVRAEGNHAQDLREHTSVTGRVRRIARFDPSIVRQALTTDQPSEIVLNHVDYIDSAAAGGPTPRAQAYVDWVSEQIGQSVDYVGVGPGELLSVRSRGYAAR